MQYIFYLLTGFTFLYLLSSERTISAKVKKHDKLIQNLDSSRETQNQISRLLTNKLWEIENPPKYKVGQKIKSCGNQMIISEVRAIHPDNTKYFEFKRSYWSYSAINLKTGVTTLL